MGFSVSGSVAIISIGVLVAFGVMFPTVIDSSHQVSDAQSAQSERILDQQNTDIRINQTSYDSGANELTIEVVNEGTVALEVDETDVIVNGTYETPNGTTVYQTLDKANGDSSTNVWLSGEVLEIVVGADSKPGRVKIVTENGVADATEEVQ